MRSSELTTFFPRAREGGGIYRVTSGIRQTPRPSQCMHRQCVCREASFSSSFQFDFSCCLSVDRLCDGSTAIVRNRHWLICDSSAVSTIAYLHCLKRFVHHSRWVCVRTVPKTSIVYLCVGIVRRLSVERISYAVSFNEPATVFPRSVIQ